MDHKDALCLMDARDMGAQDLTLREAAAALRTRGHSRAAIGAALGAIAEASLPAFASDGGPVAP